jgi:hypothetical protein
MKSVFSTLCALLLHTTLSAQFTTITSDPSGDGSNSAYLDGTLLEYSYDAPSDSVFFRITNSVITPLQSLNLGFNIMVNYPGGGSTFNFWGSDNANPYHKLVTGWVTGMAPSNYSGTIGISDAAGVSNSNYTSLFSNNLDIVVNGVSKTITIGMKRSDLIPDEAMGQPIVTAAAVGTSTGWNDDLYSATGTMTLVNNIGIAEQGIDSELIVFPNPVSNGVFGIDTDLDLTQVSIYDISGKLISTITNGFSHIELDSEIVAGIYFLEMHTKNSKHTTKLIVE